MSVSHRLICFACKQERVVLLNQGVIPPASAWLFTTRLPFKGGGTLSLLWSFFIRALWEAKTGSDILDSKDAIVTKS